MSDDGQKDQPAPTPPAEEPTASQEAAAPSVAPATPVPDIPDAPSPPPLAGVSAPVGDGGNIIDQHPEILVGAAFVGGLVVAAILKRRGG